MEDSAGRLVVYITEGVRGFESSSFPLSVIQTMPRASSSRRPTRVSSGLLSEGVEYNIFNFQSAHNSSRPYLNRETWYRCSDTDVPDDSFEDLGNVVV